MRKSVLEKIEKIKSFKNQYCKEILSVEHVGKRYLITFIDNKFGEVVKQYDREFLSNAEPKVLKALLLKERAINTWGDIFDYTNTIFESVGKKIKFAHKETGLELEQSLQLHINGSLPIELNSWNNFNRVKNIFIRPDGSPEFDYSNTDFSSTNNIIEFIHIESGIKVRQTYNKHLSGAYPKSKELTLWKFKKRAESMYGDKYKYLPCDKDNYVKVVSDGKTYLQRMDNHIAGKLPKGLSGPTSKSENYIADYIRNLGFEVVQSSRPDFMNGQELDIFIPSKNFAIEYNGSIFHNSNKLGSDFILSHSKDKKYHYEKWKLCNDTGVRLLSIYDFYFADEAKREIYLSKIKHYLGLDGRIYARKCRIAEISNSESKLFYKNNHLEGCGFYQKDAKSFGIYYQDQIMMCFTIHEEYSQSNKVFELKLHRICTLNGVTVVGGISMASKFIKRNFGKFKYLITLSSGGSSLIGQCRIIDPRYFWVNPKTLEYYHRNECQKGRLESKFGEPVLNDDTEETYMSRLGYLKVYDNGLAEILMD